MQTILTSATIKDDEISACAGNTKALIIKDYLALTMV